MPSLGGLTPGQLPVEADPSFKPMNSYQAAFMNLDPDGPQYISANAGDEQSHASFLNAYLQSVGAEPVDLDDFRTLPSSQAKGAQQIGRLTNLTKLSVDTSWYVRYRSATNPDLGAKATQALPALSAGQFTAIPRNNADFTPKDHIQAIANTAAFHFGFIEQGGASLYASMSQKVKSAEALQITLGIGGDEICHFLEWVDFSGNSVQPPLAPLTDPTNGLTFPNFDALNAQGKVNPLLQTNLIFPVPCEFIHPKLFCRACRRITYLSKRIRLLAAQHRSVTLTEPARPLPRDRSILLQRSVPIRLTQTPTRASVDPHGGHGHPPARRSGFSSVAP